MKNIFYWIIDYFFLLRGRVETLVYRNSPDNYIKQNTHNGINIILIQGINASWVYLKKIGDELSGRGYSVYTIPELGRNMDLNSVDAKKVVRFIIENNLQNVVIIAHSKGGLIAKYVLVEGSIKERIIKVITIGTPFNGTILSKEVPHPAYKILR